jgi:hypothetical protein
VAWPEDTSDEPPVALPSPGDLRRFLFLGFYRFALSTENVKKRDMAGLIFSEIVTS